MKQLYFNKLALTGNVKAKIQLCLINLNIKKWFSTEAKSTILLINTQEIEESENMNLYHHKIVETYSTLQALKEQLQSKQEQLDSYRNLPPNMSLAKEKIQEAEEDLKKLEEMFENLLVK